MEGTAGMIRGIDICMYQSDIDATRLPDFVIIKATQDDWEDVTFNGSGTYDGRRRFLFRDAVAQERIVGAYHFLHHGNVSGGEQALIFVRALKRANNAHCDGALCVLFVEHDVKRKSLPNSKDVSSFIETFKRLVPNQALIIATNAPYWSSHIRLDLQRYDDVYVMLERWTDASGQIDSLSPMVPDDWWNIDIGGRKPSLIQFTSQARVGNVRTDGILYRGDRASLARLAEVSIPFTRTRPNAPMPDRLRTPRFVPRQASDRDDRKRAGKTTLVTAASLLGAFAVILAFAFVAWRGTNIREPIFDDAL